MKNLVKIGLFRLSKNLFFIAGCVLAFVITYWFLVTRPIPQLERHSAADVAIFISAAIILFFSMFVGLFGGSENEDGILRNKIMAGYTQYEVYFSNLFSLQIAMVIMLVCWLLGALFGGTEISLRLLVYFLVAVIYNSAYIALIQAIVFRMKKQVVGVVLSLGLFYVLLISVMMGNFFYMITEGNEVFQKLIVVFYNLSALGQCFARTDFSDPGLANTFIQILASVIVFALATFLGTLRLNKRDIN